MPEIDWYEIRFMESSSNLKGLLKKSIGREPSTKVAREIATCIRQGRLFFETAISSPLEIQPLQIFYGVIGFAAAIALSRKLVSISTLPQKHGLKDVSGQDSLVEQMTLEFDANGMFQGFNDAVAELSRINYYPDAMSKCIFIPFDQTTRLLGAKMTIK